ncbi:MAG: hypothetical protein AAGH57_01795 [Pseudomonadota bacterium]
MKRTLSLKSALIVGAAFSVGAFPIAAQSSGLAMLDSLARGQWTIKYRDGTDDRKICVKTGQEFIQLQHDQMNCNRVVIESEAMQVTVQYTCQGAGYGRTSIRRETGALIQIESKGISSGAPFQFAAEARRTGSC